MASGEYEIRDEDRLPWLETVDEDYSEGPSILRIGLLVLIGLAIVAAAIFGIYWYQKNRELEGTGALIEAQEGDYKVKPDVVGGMKVDGEGEATLATSEGRGPDDGPIAMAPTPEAPIEGRTAELKRPEATSGPAMVPPVKEMAKPAVPVAAGKAAPVDGASGGAVVQLGSFPDEASANAAWSVAARRFGYLAPLGKAVVPAMVGSRQVYRLRVNTGSAAQASEICGKLKAAGEACFVARN